MILIIAPYSPISQTTNIHLGASRKIEIIIGLLHKIDSEIVLVNSSYNNIKNYSICSKKIYISNIEVLEITPPTPIKNSKIGKLINLFQIGQIINYLKSNFKNPQLIWFYNGYAFEMLFALMSYKKIKSVRVLEFEDWHFSRSSIFNPKSLIDYTLWRLAAPLMTSSFTVNSTLANKMKKYITRVNLLPGIVPNKLRYYQSKVPFENIENDNLINIGFFGGLYIEKGADIILSLIKVLPPNYIFHVTGAGPLSSSFESLQKMSQGKLIFYGRVDEDKLYKIISLCDVILNPHKCIESFSNGVFPFKVVEAIASGRLVVSTPLPSIGLENILDGVVYCDFTVDAFKDVILNSNKIFLDNISSINRASNITFDFYGEINILSMIKIIISSK